MRFLLALLLFPLSALADDLWLTSGWLTKHVTHDSAHYKAHGDYRENNYGIGLQYGSWSLGAYRNSMDKQSKYVSYSWHPFALGLFKAGFTAGIVDGYSFNHGRFIPMIAPSASLEYQRVGLNFIAVPKFIGGDAFVAVQAKVRF